MTGSIFKSLAENGTQEVVYLLCNHNITADGVTVLALNECNEHFTNKYSNF